MKKGKKQKQLERDACDWALLRLYLGLQGWHIEGITPESVSEFVRSATRDMKRRSDMEIIYHFASGISNRYDAGEPDNTEATE